MQKAYDPIKWENRPSENTPVNERNLNKMDVALDEVDNRVITIDLTKLDKTSASGMMTGFQLDTETGVITLSFYDGSTKAINTNLAKIALNISYDAENERLVLNMPDGTITYVDMSALITQYEFVDSDTIAYEVTADGKVKANIKNGSVTAEMLQPNYLADIRVEVSKAQSYKAEAQTSATDAANSASDAQIYANRAAESAAKAEEVVGGNFIPMSAKGAANGVASLDDSGKIPEEQLPDNVGGDITRDEVIAALNYTPISSTDNTQNNVASFTVASARANIISGEKHSIRFGKIMKWFLDLSSAAFAKIISSYSELMGNTTAGYLVDALAIKQGFEEITSDKVTVKYDSNVDDYIWVLDGGEWKQSRLRAGLLREYLFNANVNTGNFVVHSGVVNSGSVTNNTSFIIGEKLSFGINSTGEDVKRSCIISDTKTLTSFFKLVLNYEITSGNNSSYETATLFVTDKKQTVITPIASDVFFTGSTDGKSKTGTVEIDISSLSGEYYIGVELKANSTTINVNINECYME